MAVNYVKPIALTSLNTATLAGDYAVVNAAGLDEACFMLRIINDSNVDLTISYDGVTAHDYIASDKTYDIYAQASAGPASNVALFRKGQQVYVNAGAGVGYVYIAAYFNKP